MSVQNQITFLSLVLTSRGFTNHYNYIQLLEKPHFDELTLIRLLPPRKEGSEDYVELLLCQGSRGTLRFENAIQMFYFISREPVKEKKERIKSKVFRMTAIPRWCLSVFNKSNFGMNSFGTLRGNLL